MSVVSELASDPTQNLIDINPMIEMDLHLVITAFELANREGGLEEGVLVSALGELEKAKSNMVAQRTTALMYGGSEDITIEPLEPTGLLPGEEVNESASFGGAPGNPLVGDISLQGTAGAPGSGTLQAAIGPNIDPDNPFSKCFPCDFRLTAMIDNLPLPDFALGYGTFAAEMEGLATDLKNIANPANFYGDICSLIDILRIVCPQDLLILIGMLGYLIATYMMLAFQFDIDWIAIVGALLLPLIMLIYALLDMLISLGLNPVLCLKDLFNFILALASGTAATLPGVGISATAQGSYEESVAVAGGLGESFRLSAGLNFPVTSTYLDDSLKGATATFSAIDNLFVSISSIEFKIPDLFKQIKKVKEILLEMIGKGAGLKIQIMSSIIQIGRLIGFIKALIKLIEDQSICTDATIPLSPEDVQAVVDKINDINDPDANLSLPGRISSPISLTTQLEYDSNIDAIIVKDASTNEIHTVPTCLGKIKETDQDKINDWVAELDAID